MERKDFVKYWQEQTSLSEVQMEQMLSAIAAIIKERALILEGVLVQNIGVFYGEKYEEKIEKNDQTGHYTMMPPRIELHYSAMPLVDKKMLSPEKLLATIHTKTAIDPIEIDHFIKLLATTISEELGKKGSVQIPELGCFKRTISNTTFYPASLLQESVNSPFSAFVPEELADNSPLLQTFLEEQSAIELGRVQKELVEKEQPKVVEANKKELKPSITTLPKKHAHRWIWATLTIIFLVIGAGVVLFFRDTQSSLPMPKTYPTVEEKKIIPADTILREVDLREVDVSVPPTTDTTHLPPVIEIVTSGTTLARLAAKHYGDRELWTLIYEANKEKISNPNQLEIGIRLLIPPTK